MVLKLFHTSDSSSITFVAKQTKTLYFTVYGRWGSSDFSFSKMNDGITTTTFLFIFLNKEAY